MSGRQELLPWGTFERRRDGRAWDADLAGWVGQRRKELGVEGVVDLLDRLERPLPAEDVAGGQG